MQPRVATNASSVHRCLPDADIDIDGPSAEESLADMNSEFDFRSTDGISSLSDVDVVSFRSDETETSSYTTYTQDESETMHGKPLKSQYI